MSTNEQLFAKREKRFNDVVALRRPDRVPVIPLITHYFPTKIKGISNKEAGYDCALRHGAVKEATLEFGWDMCPHERRVLVPQLRCSGHHPDPLAGRRLGG